MPQADFVEVNVTLRPAAAPRPSFGVSMILHSLTEAQSLAFGGPKYKLLTPQSWAADMAALGITDGEAAYEDVQAHFSGQRKPARAYIGRRGVAQAQVWAVQVPASPADGSYIIVVNGIPYDFTASSSSQAAVRTGLITDIGTPAWGTATADGAVAGKILLASGTPGVGLTVSVVSPASSMTAAVQTPAFQATRAQIWQIDVNTATPGPYVLTAQTTAGQKTYTHVALAGATLTTIRDAIMTAYAANPSDLFENAMTSVDADKATLKASLAGRPGTLSLTTPNNDAVLSVTTANYGVADDWQALNDQNGDWYQGILGSHTEADLLLSDEKFASLRKIVGLQTSDEDVITAPTTSVAGILKSRASLRTWAVYHPLDAEGVHSAWAADVLTDRAGEVSWVGRPLTGLTANAFTSASTSATLRANEMSFLEDFAAREQHIMNGGYSMAGRPIDITRAMDTLWTNIEIALMDLIVTNRIVPYSKDGIEQGYGTIVREFNSAVDQGYAVAGTLELTKPSVEEASEPDRIRGILPTYTGSCKFQAGVYKIKANIEVYQ